MRLCNVLYLIPLLFYIFKKPNVLASYRVAFERLTNISYLYTYILCGTYINIILYTNFYIQNPTVHAIHTKTVN